VKTSFPITTQNVLMYQLC